MDHPRRDARITFDTASDSISLERLEEVKEEEEKVDNEAENCRNSKSFYNAYSFNGGKRVIDIPADVFSMMIFSKTLSCTMAYGIFVFSVQMTILLAILIDLINSGVPGNRLNVPVNVTAEVRLAQLIAILIAGVSNEDVIQSFGILCVGWKGDLKEQFPDATPIKFVIANLLRASEGLGLIMVSLIFIIQSQNVLDIFMNFAAVSFVASLDDVGFHLAREGWLGGSMKRFALSMEDVKLPARKRETDWLFAVKPSLVVILLVVLVVTLACFGVRQSSGAILEALGCGEIHVMFGDHVYLFSDDGPEFTFQTQRAEGYDNFFDPYGETLHDDDLKNRTYDEALYRSLVGSTRLLSFRFDPLHPPDVHYVYFSGLYNANFDHLENSRPVYYERGFRDITSGMFYYCAQEGAWVFTIPAFLGTTAMPDHMTSRCKYGWLMRSPVTEAFFLDQAPGSGWVVWTGVLVPAGPDFVVMCSECNSDFECGSSVSHGRCVAKHCVCEDAAGPFCNEEPACHDLIVFKGADDENEGTRYPPGGNNTFKTFRNIGTLLPAKILIHQRPAYWLEKTFPGDEIIYEVLMYTGRRWVDAYFHQHEFPITLNDTRKIAFFERFHAYWNNVLISNAWWISEPAFKYMPTGLIQWQAFVRSMAVGNYGSFPARVNIDQRLECYSVDCGRLNVCGILGGCVEREVEVDKDGYVIKGNKCDCEATYYGHYCEYQTKAPVVVPTTTPVSVAATTSKPSPAPVPISVAKTTTSPSISFTESPTEPISVAPTTTSPSISFTESPTVSETFLTVSPTSAESNVETMPKRTFFTQPPTPEPTEG